jgi:hypothetical protein
MRRRTLNVVENWVGGEVVGGLLLGLCLGLTLRQRCELEMVDGRRSQ